MSYPSSAQNLGFLTVLFATASSGLATPSLDAMASRVWEYARGGTETVEPIALMPGSLERVVFGPTTWGTPITREAVLGDALSRVWQENDVIEFYYSNAMVFRELRRSIAKPDRSP